MHCVPLFVGSLLVVLAPIARAQVTPVRSSLEATSRINLSVVNLVDEAIISDGQGAALSALGPLATPVSVSSADGLFTANSTASAVFVDAASGNFAATQIYEGDQSSEEPTAQSFGHTLAGTFEYDFTVQSDASVRFQGTLTNSGPSFIGFTARVRVFSEFVPGGGFTGSFFEQLVTDQTTPGSTPFDITVPLTANSGSYRIQLRLGHSGNSILDTDPETGSTTINWTIDAPTPCPADWNGDASVDAADVLDFLADSDAGDPSADIDGVAGLDFFDMLSFLALVDAGCD